MSKESMHPTVLWANNSLQLVLIIVNLSNHQMRIFLY